VHSQKKSAVTCHVTVLKFCRSSWCSASRGFVSDSWATCLYSWHSSSRGPSVVSQLLANDRRWSLIASTSSSEWHGHSHADDCFQRFCLLTRAVCLIGIVSAVVVSITDPIEHYTASVVAGEVVRLCPWLTWRAGCGRSCTRPTTSQSSHQRHFRHYDNIDLIHYDISATAGTRPRDWILFREIVYTDKFLWTITWGVSKKNNPF